MKRFPQIKIGQRYHVFNRGIARRKIFTDEVSYRYFLYKLAVFRNKYGIKLIAYCIMPSHFHLLIYTNENPVNISKFMQALQHSYAIFYCKRNKLSGHIFESNFKNRYIHPFDIQKVIAYILQNPVKEKLVDKPEDWPYSWVFKFNKKND